MKNYFEDLEKKEDEAPEYEVRDQFGKVVFRSTVYALCNSYIFTHALQGVRPKLAKN